MNQCGKWPQYVDLDLFNCTDIDLLHGGGSIATWARRIVAVLVNENEGKLWRSNST
jgi:hypothetical protein